MSVWAPIIAAIGTMLTAVALVITAWTANRNTRRVERKVEDVHKIVNQQQTDMKNYQAALIRALEAKGIEVPVDQSAPLPPDTTDRRMGGAQ